jgi:hypothetical protein
MTALISAWQGQCELLSDLRSWCPWQDSNPQPAV